MRTDEADDRLAEGRKTRRFWMHLADNLLRHALLYAIPVMLLTAMGVVLAQRSATEFSSTATIDASSNPLVEEVQVRGADDVFYKTTAETTADLMGEQLRTDVFAAEVADAAGLGGSFDAGLIDADTIRRQVAVSPNGDSIIKVTATWSDSVSAQALTEATIDTYRNYVVGTVAQDGQAAEDFYSELRDQAAGQVAEAEVALDTYVSSLPPLREDEEYTVAVELTIQRLNSALDRAEAGVEDAQGEIEAAQLQVAQSLSDTGASIRLVDAPTLPLEPQPRLFQIVGLVGAFFALGLIISAAALILTTALSRTVRFDIDVIDEINTPYVATVPTLKWLEKSPEPAAGLLEIGPTAGRTDGGIADPSDNAGETSDDTDAGDEPTNPQAGEHAQDEQRRPDQRAAWPRPLPTPSASR